MNYGKTSITIINKTMTLISIKIIELGKNKSVTPV